MNALLPALLLLATATTGHAQPAQAQASAAPEDWVLTVVPDQKATLALVEFTSGISLAARCVDDAYDLLITGLPEAPQRATTRDLGLAVGDDDVTRRTIWTVGEDRTTAFSRIPAMVARRLAKGGELQIVAQGPDDRRYRYVMDINPSSTAIEQTLTACGRPLVDPRDSLTEGEGQDGLPAPFTWERLPNPDFSTQALDAGEGYAALSCMPQQDGRLSECRIESEWPRRLGIGRAALRSMGRARLRQITTGDGSEPRFDNRVVAFAIAFKVK